jgi:hypothetical protein
MTLTEKDIEQVRDAHAAIGDEHGNLIAAICTLAMNNLKTFLRPIEDAPQDGTDILAFIPYNEGGGYFFERLSWGYYDEWGTSKAWIGRAISPYAYEVHQPTFFIPAQLIPYPNPTK